MISENLLNSAKLTNQSKSFQKNNPIIWEIVMYGSAVEGKLTPRDIDIALILNQKTTLNEKLEISQQFRKRLQDCWKKEFEVRAVDLLDFLDSNFLARTGILATGFSLLQKRPLSEIFGFQNFFIFLYELKGLNPSKKKMFYYALKGRRGSIGILQRVKGEQIGDGAIKIPQNNYYEIKELLDGYKLKYQVKKALFY